MMQACPVCRCPATEEYLPDDPDNLFVVACARCGSFKAEEEFCKQWLSQPPSEQQQANLSAWIRRHNGAGELRLANIEEYLTLRTLTVAEKADALLVGIAKEFAIPGMGIAPIWNLAKWVDDLIHNIRIVSPRFEDVPPIGGDWEDLRYLAISGAANAPELHWLIDNCLKREGLLVGADKMNFHISPKGWQRIEQLRTGGIESRSGFVAMNFAQEFDVLFDQVMMPGIEAAGYIANRVGKRQSNERIDDEIIAGIRECRFMVADASGHRPNVYYEAGYAKGLGRDVIWMVEEKDRATLHFDTRQYPYITWKRDALPEACKALEMRIAATIGRGPARRNGESLRD